MAAANEAKWKAPPGVDTANSVCKSGYMNISRHPAWFAGVSCLFSVCLTTPATGQTNSIPSQRERNKAIVRKTLDSNTREYGANSNMLVRPGLLANRAEKWVRVQAEAVGLRPDYPCEFMLIAEASGHDYESLMVSFAKPSDIHESLVFVGMKPGRPVDADKYRFWPKGERIVATVEWDNDGHFRARGESLLVNRNMHGPLPKDGFVFVGSVMKNSPNEPAGTKVYAADTFDPNCIVSYFNDPETVLDVPRVAGQGAMYDLQRPNPDYSFATGQLVNVTFEPEYKDGRKRVADFVMKIMPPARSAATTVSNVVIRVTDDAGTNVVDGGRFQDALAVFEQVVRNGRDPFVRVELDGELPLSAIHNVCEFLDAINTEKGIRIDPPPGGHAYYRAFIPDEKLRDRANRSVQPWEFKISRDNGVTGGTLTLIEDKLDREADRWTIVTNSFEASTPDALRTTFEKKTDDGSRRIGPLYVFIFAPKSMLYKTLAPFVAACIETRPYVHVYLE